MCVSCPQLARKSDPLAITPSLTSCYGSGAGIARTKSAASIISQPGRQRRISITTGGVDGAAETDNPMTGVAVVVEGGMRSKKQPLEQKALRRRTSLFGGLSS